MGLFSIFKKKGDSNLTKEDFKSSEENYEVISVKFSDDFFKKFPQVKKKKNYTGKKTLITKSTKIDLFGNNIQILYDMNVIEQKEERFIEYINQKIVWITKNEKTINSRIANKLVLLKNNNWLEQNETKISKIEFIKRISLSMIFFHGDGNAKLTFEDDDLFWGHQILVNLNKRNKLNEIHISG